MKPFRSPAMASRSTLLGMLRPLCLAALLAQSTPVAARAAQSSAAVDTADSRSTPKAIRISPQEIRIGTMLVDEARRCLRVPGHVNMDRGVVEVLACTAWGKTHESVLVLDVPPHVLQVGLLLLGVNRSADRDSADRVAIQVTPKGGKTVLAEDLLLDLRTQKRLPANGWWFRGSTIRDGVFAAELGGTLVATYADPDAVLDNPADTATDDTVIGIDSETVPPRGTPVSVEFSKWPASEHGQGTQRGGSPANSPAAWPAEAAETRGTEPLRAGGGAIPEGGMTAPVVVTASRLNQPLADYPGSVFELGRREAIHLPALDSGALLQGIPGFHFFDATGNQSRWVASPRGFTGSGEGEYIELLVDGTPANELQKGIADFNLLPVSSLQSVEVLRGPGSALFGDLATAGVIALVSQPQMIPWVAMRGGTYDNFSVESGAGLSGTRGYCGGSAGWMQSDGWRRNSTWKEAKLVARGSLRLGRGQTLSASGLEVHADRRDPGAISRDWLVSQPREAFFPRDGEKGDRVLGGLTLTGSLAPWLEQSTHLYVRTRDADITRSLAAALQAVEERREVVDERAVGGEVRGLARLLQGRQLLQLGVETERGTLDDIHYQEDARTTASSALVRRVKLAPYLQSVTDLRHGFQLTLGARYDWFQLRFDQTTGGDGRSRRTMNRFSPKSALNFHWKTGNVFVSASELFKIPTLDQLYDQRHPFGLPLSNPDLEPQRGNNFEIGARVHPDLSTSAEIVVYRTRMHKEISFDAESFVYKNVGKSDHTGIELALHRRWSRLLSTDASYAWTYAFFRSGDVDGKRINNVPAHRGFVTLSCGLPLDLVLGLTQEVNSSQQLDEDNTHALRGFTTTNMRLRRDFGRVGGYLDVDNVFDQRYATSGYVLPFDGAELLYPGTARNVCLGLELRR